MEIVEVSEKEQLFKLREAWNAIAAAMPEATIFQTWEWNWIWWSHFAAGKLMVLIAKKHGETVGIAPFFVEPVLGSFRWLKFVGTGRMSNALALLAQPALADECRRHFLDYLSKRSEAWDLVDLLHVDEQAARALANDGRDADAVLTPGDIDLHIDLPGDSETYLKQLDSKFKRNIRRRKKLIAADFSESAYETVRGGEVGVAMEELFRLHELRWKGRELFHMLSSEIDRRFHMEIATELDRLGRLRLHRLKIDGVTRAVLYGFRFGDATSAYATRFDPQLARYGPGILLHEHAILEAIADGARRFDLMRGVETWKYRLGAKERRNYHVELVRRSQRSKLAFRLNRLGYHVWGVMMAERQRLAPHEGADGGFWSRTTSRLLVSGLAHRIFGIGAKRSSPEESNDDAADPS